MKIFIIAALLVISYVAASPKPTDMSVTLTEEEEFDLLDRVARSAKNKEAKEHWENFVNSKGKTIRASEVKCPKGKKAEIEKDENGDLLSLRCVKCEEGKYTKVKGLFDSCSSCPEGKSTLAGKNDKCIDFCPAGKGYVSKPTKGRPRCMACEDDTYNDGDGPECKPCPEFHKVKKSDMKSQNKTATKSECKLECPGGFIKTKDDNCKPCGHGNFTNPKGDECKRCNKSKPFTLSNANKGGKACFALKDEKEKSCYKYMFDALKEYGPKMKEKKEENKDEERVRDDNDDDDDEDRDEGGRPGGGPTGSGSDDGSRKTGGQGSGGQSPKRKRRAAQAGDQKTKQTKKEKKALAKEEKEKKEKKEKQERGKSLRSAICKGKGSLDDLRTKFRECKALEAERGKKLIPEFKKVNNGKKVEIKDILEKEDGVDANCEDVDEDEAGLNRCGTGYQSGWHSSSGHISSGPSGSSRPGGSSGSSGSSGAGRSSGPGGSSRPGGSSGSSGSSGAGRSSGPGGSIGPGGSSGPGSSSGSSSGMSGPPPPPQSGGGAGGGATGGGKPGSGGRARR